jgi:hypothetical protein
MREHGYDYVCSGAFVLRVNVNMVQLSFLAQLSFLFFGEKMNGVS